ncbi:hypothetical protein ACMAZE_08515 [Pseudopelagicola sp. nBUS_20]|uniref:hypothetical protein n=1 Tax=Pseudopelagicola sp. nBUS_20 TaxID=3395317 RepID=UPI003EBC5F3B
MTTKHIEIQKCGSAWEIVEFDAEGKRITLDNKRWQYKWSVDEAIHAAVKVYGKTFPILVRGPAGVINKIINP